jgi:ubiquinone/menaquinone biosynthesis C-methylase UbiE
MLKDKFWSVFGRIYDLWTFSKTYRVYQNAVMAELDKFGLPKGCHVYDPGAGCGHYAIQLARAGYRVTATDISPSMLAVGARRAAQESLDSIEWSAEDLSKPIRWKDGEFDALVSVHAFFSVFDVLEPIIAEFARVVKPNSPVLICGREIPCSLLDFVKIETERFSLMTAIMDLCLGLGVFGFQKLATLPHRDGAVFDNEKTPKLFAAHGFKVLTIKQFSGYFSQHDVICVLQRST